MYHAFDLLAALGKLSKNFNLKIEFCYFINFIVFDRLVPHLLDSFKWLFKHNVFIENLYSSFICIICPEKFVVFLKNILWAIMSAAISIENFQTNIKYFWNTQSLADICDSHKLLQNLIICVVICSEAAATQQLVF